MVSNSDMLCFREVAAIPSSARGPPCGSVSYHNDARDNPGNRGPRHHWEKKKAAGRYGQKNDEQRHIESRK
jgi:hypothetical protein